MMSNQKKVSRLLAGLVFCALSLSSVLTVVEAKEIPIGAGYTGDPDCDECIRAFNRSQTLGNTGRTTPVASGVGCLGQGNKEAGLNPQDCANKNDSSAPAASGTDGADGKKGP